MRRLGWLAALATLTLAGSAGAAVPSWTTYHGDGLRSGIDQGEGAAVSPSQLWQTAALDGKVYGQPLVYGSRVYVATENDTVYALDSGSGAVVWSRHLATPVPSSSLPCGDISPSVGITSTPVIDPSSGRIFVVADTLSGSVQHQMFGLNLADGSLAAGPVAVDPPGSTPTAQLQRASLALDAGKVVIGYGGNDGDCGSYHGWLVAVPEAGGSLQTFEVDGGSGQSQGAIWGSGNAPPVDSAGDVWVATGNGTSSSFGYQESVLKLDSNLGLLDWWAPSNWSSLDSSDTDLGSTMPLPLANGLVFEIGKAGVGYLLSGSSLGHTGANPVFSASVCNGSWGGGVYWGGVIYVACNDGLHALAVNLTSRTFAPLSGWAVNSSATAPPIVAGGMVWSAGTGNGTLYGLDPSTGASRFSANLGGFEHFTSPSAAAGRLFVANQDRVTAFTVAQSAPSTPTATSTALAASPDPSTRSATVTLTATVSPVPDGGTVAFADGGAAIAGCGSVAVSTASGQASCATTFSRAGAHQLVAGYSGDSSYAPSSSAGVLEGVIGPPVISGLHGRYARGGVRATLHLSEGGKLTLAIARLVPGRLKGRRCVVRRRRGRRCFVLARRQRFVRSGRPGADAYQLRLRLPPGRYRLRAVCTGVGGQRSNVVWVYFTVRAPRRR